MEDSQRRDPTPVRPGSSDNGPVARGRLKVFFGYAAGVGKTYAMLQAAHSARDAGLDVVVGCIEANTRPATLALLVGLERLAPLPASRPEERPQELDLDAAIARRPQLLLVDGLAHTNAEGSRHRRRYQDISELLRLVPGMMVG
ncbi:MAG: histidine kinase, partial [Oscillospiraceae bacterium]